MVYISSFKKSYGQHVVLEVEKLEISTGIHWFKGVNGSGKSTFFKCLAGILPFKGEIFWQKEQDNPSLDVRKDAVAYRMLVNYSEAEPLFPDYLTGNDLLKFIAEAKQAPATQITQLIDSLQVKAFINQPIGTYSSGMLKKFSLLLAFLGKPQLIILDEPLITIDTQAVQKIYELIKYYHEKLGVSFLLSSHQDFRREGTLFEELTINSTFLVQNQTIRQLS